MRTKTGDNGVAPNEVCDNGTTHAKTGDNGKSPPEGGLLPDRDTPPTGGRGKLLFAVGMP
ncbi:hypothetical protein [Sodalis praecaptivus]|uniref:hypothetical protein n=1 Tax=Sodalis praecaptivus TaxID=1239307 RepID=UPI0031F99FC8